MNQLVSYAESSSDDEDKCSAYPSTCKSTELSNPTPTVQSTKIKMVNGNAINSHSTHLNRSKDTYIIDLPITDESDDQSGEIVDRDNKLHKILPNSKSKCKSTDHHDHGGATRLTQSVCFQNKVADVTLTHSACQKNMHCQGVVSDKLTDKKSHISNTKDNVVMDMTDLVSAQNCPFSKGNNNMSSSIGLPILQTFESESSNLNRKRKCNSDSDKQLHVPDSIHSMYPGRQQKWMDDPADHHNRIRSFPHLEGNWATHVFIPVVKNEPFVRFVDCLLKLLMPPTFEVLQDFHVSLSRTVTVRYHWIEPMVDSLRKNLKNLKSCISDFVAVKLFTNDEKTRTFVTIELSQDDREFLDFVKAVDKSFGEFKLPAYYENPSFHISVGWCLGDAVEELSREKLSKAQEMLSEFIAANPDLSFVYVCQICCQSGCKSFVIPLQDSVM